MLGRGRLGSTFFEDGEAVAQSLQGGEGLLDPLGQLCGVFVRFLRLHQGSELLLEEAGHHVGVVHTDARLCLLGLYEADHALSRLLLGEPLVSYRLGLAGKSTQMLGAERVHAVVPSAALVAGLDVQRKILLDLLSSKGLRFGLLHIQSFETVSCSKNLKFIGNNRRCRRVFSYKIKPGGVINQNRDFSISIKIHYLSHYRSLI